MSKTKNSEEFQRMIDYQELFTFSIKYFSSNIQ